MNIDYIVDNMISDFRSSLSLSVIAKCSYNEKFTRQYFIFSEALYNPLNSTFLVLTRTIERNIDAL